MPGGKGKIRPSDNPKPFTSDNQPTNSGRKPGSRAWKDVLADMMGEDGYLTFDKAQELDDNGVPTGNVIKKVRVKMATQEMIVMAAIKQAMKGKTDAIKMIWERMDGRPTQPIEGKHTINASVSGAIAELTEDQLEAQLKNLEQGE